MKFDKDEEEFEFKPLTQGLGFHPRKENQTSKSVPLTKELASANLNTKSTPAPQPTLKSTLLDTPLPRPQKTNTTQAPSQSGKAVESILKSLNDKNKNFQFTAEKQKAVSPYLQVTPGLAAGFLDLLLITSLGLVYMLSLILTLKVDLIKTLSEGDPRVWIATGAIFLGVGFVYYTAQRIFLGFTLGDWAYEQRLGLPEEMQKTGYSLKVVARQLLVMGTGIITLPLISWIMGRDIAGISGLCMYRKR